MRLPWRCIALCALAGLLECQAEEASSSVVVLTSENFEAEIGGSNSSTPWFVKFYAPWCGHCKALAPTWEDLAKKLSGSVKVGEVDVTKDRWLGDQWGIQGYPTLLFITEGKVYHYQGRRDPRSLEAWVRDGWKEQNSSLLPWDQPFLKRTLPTEEDIARRKEFEAMLREHERRLSEMDNRKRGSRASSTSTSSDQTPDASDKKLD